MMVAVSSHDVQGFSDVAFFAVQIAFVVDHAWNVKGFMWTL